MRDCRAKENKRVCATIIENQGRWLKSVRVCNFVITVKITVITSMTFDDVKDVNVTKPKKSMKIL